MSKRLLSVFLTVFISFGVMAQSQPGHLRGKVTDKISGEEIPMAQVDVLAGNAVIAKGSTDFDGIYSINPIDPGTYTIRVSIFGYNNYELSGVKVAGGRPTEINVKMQTASTELGEVTVTASYEAPLIEKGKTSQTVSKEAIKNLAGRDLGSIVSMTSGVYVANEGSSSFNARGGRESSNQVFIDGVKVRGNVNLPREAIEQTEVITGGLPAQYGDVTGGVVSTTTRGPSPIYFGNVEYLTSSLFDNYHYNLLGLTAGGPLLKNSKGVPVLGFLVAGEFEYQYDPRPWVTGVYTLKDDELAALEANPLRPSAAGLGTLSSGEYITNDDLQNLSARQNSDTREYRITGNINIKPSLMTNIVVGGRYNYTRGKSGTFANQLANYSNNSESERTDWSTYIRFRQSFDSDSSSLFKNAYYQIQFDYTRNQGSTYDPRFGDNIFAYGHVGKFENYKIPGYTFGTDSATGLTGWLQSGFVDTALVFTPGSYNPVLANYTSAVYSFANQGLISNNLLSFNDIRQAGGLMNGDNPNSIYSLFSNVGAISTGYSHFQNSQFRMTASTSFEIKGHNIIAGIEYEQRFDRSFGVASQGLWNLMRNLQNQAILELDTKNPNPVYDGGVFQDTVNYSRAFDANVSRSFDANLRSSLGLDPNGTDVLDIDSYDPSTFSLDMFSASELLNIGATQYVSYYGYDHTGKLTSGNASLSDFFTKRDANGNLTREIPAFQPIYMAGYIQDQFTFEDLFFNVGVRVDRFDANQPVLKDPYSLYSAHTVGDLRNTNDALVNQLVGSVGDDYVVYVNDVRNPTAILGYRSGDTWFNADGSVQANPKVISDLSGGQALPYLFEENFTNSTSNDRPTVSTAGFTDYSPQITVSPRISFQFPISEEAEFFAHYDLLVQRPDAGLNRFDPVDYLNMEQNPSGTFISNANLLPQKTTDYEVGFRQKLTERSALKISAFYREMRDMMQSIVVSEAYPSTYYTYGNRDFGTVKGFTLGYDLRRTSNVMMNVNYTLQFADGTGSSANSGANLARSGQPNLRYIQPLSYDVRHQLTANLDFRYSSGTEYNGPVWWNVNVFENAGFNLLAVASSGTPFTRRYRAYSLVAGNGGIPIVGTINGSRLPWQFRIDATVNKVWYFGDQKRQKSFEVYVQVLNLLNTRNVQSVYDYTGDSDDDGYLASPTGQNAITTQTNAQSFVDLYNLAMVNPYNYSMPRRIRLGIRFGF